MIYKIYDGGKKAPEAITLRLISNDRISGTDDVSVVAVDRLGQVEEGGYICTFQKDGSLFLVRQVGKDFGFKLDSFRRIIVS